MKITEIIPNPDNPRTIRGDKFKKLVKSIKEFPEMLKLRPIVIDEDNIVLGGNMRLRACTEAGLTDVPVKVAKGLTEDQKKEFIVKDNVAFGEWNWDMLANTWDAYELDEMGVDLDPEMFKIDDDNETLAEANDKAKYNDYTIFFRDERQMDIWFSFMHKLKNKFIEYDNVSDRVLRWIAEVYDENDMKESDIVLKFIELADGEEV
jgi:hypothetical protein